MKGKQLENQDLAVQKTKMLFFHLESQEDKLHFVKGYILWTVPSMKHHTKLPY